jgi:hypothetical protein
MPKLNRYGHVLNMQMQGVLCTALQSRAASAKLLPLLVRIWIHLSCHSKTVNDMKNVPTFVIAIKNTDNLQILSNKNHFVDGIITYILGYKKRHEHDSNVNNLTFCRLPGFSCVLSIILIATWKDRMHIYLAHKNSSTKDKDLSGDKNLPVY